jgi:3-deoxy-manno-octulosonate cytidylyltransferase (CMP-KDO synthetase)
MPLLEVLTEERMAANNSRPISQIVIPARLNSQRLPRKMLLAETGKSLLQHTYEAASRAKRPSGVVIATDSLEIAAEVTRFGGRYAMTDPNCASGTDRIAEVARAMPHVDIFVNVQGDEPEIDGRDIDRVVQLLADDTAAVMSTMATPIRSREKLHNPACVKVVFDGRGRALYFSRSMIPAVRDWRDELLDADPPHFFQHLGLYAYRREFLLQLAALPRTDLEKLESLEQLRVLYHGESILVGVTEHAGAGIDTPEDYAAFVARRRKAG